MDLIITASKSRSFNAIHNGWKIRVTPLQYLCKYGDHLDSMTYDPKQAHMIRLTMDRVCKAWDTETPKFVVSCDREDKTREGLTVYAYDGDVITDDTIPGPIVGTLRRQGRRWVVEPKEAT
jgi:hypothetical protein